MERIWFTSDLHFGHHKEFLWGPRGFNSSKEHDKAIIENWNSVVEPEDTVYILGDLMLEDNEYGINCLQQLKGNIYIIRGNHDTLTRMELYKQYNWLHPLDFAIELKINKNYFYLSHYPTITANYDDNKPWAKHLINLHGHTHSKEKFYNDNPYMYNVALDAHNNYPVSLEQILEDVRSKKIKRDEETIT